MENNYYKSSAGEIISKGADNVVRNIIDILIIGAIFMIPVIILGYFSVNALVDMDPKDLLAGNIPNFKINGSGIALTIITSIIGYIADIFGASAVIKLLNSRSMGQDFTWKEALAFVWERKFAIILISLLVGVVLVATCLILLLIAIALGFIKIALALIIFIPLFFFLVLLFTALQPLYLSTLIIRETSVLEGFSTTNKLIKSNFGKLFLIGALAAIVSAIMGMSSSVPIIGGILSSILTFIVVSFVNACDNIIIEEEFSDSDEDFFNENNSGFDNSNYYNPDNNDNSNYYNPYSDNNDDSNL